MKLARFNEKTEVFFSVQGEGKNSGRPSVFVRLSTCNLKCVWCDTPYTWNWKEYSKKEEIIEMSPKDIAGEIKKYPCKNIVLTGGEPLLQQNDLAELMRLLNRSGYFFEIETNATLLPLETIDQMAGQYNCSPKLVNSGNSPAAREHPKALKFFAGSPKAFFKFVMESKKDLQEVCNLIQKYQIPKERVYLMPEGKTPQEIRKKEAWLAPLCQEMGVCFSDRLHIHLFDGRRGT